MNYDSDKTDDVLAQLRDAVAQGDMKPAMKLLRHADAGGALRRGSKLLPGLEAALGKRPAAALVKAFASDPCPYCTAGCEKCEECRGKGHFDDAEVCKTCAGLGLRRCPFCNGTSFAGYDFVPRGLRPAVMAVRLAHALEQLDSLTARAQRPPTSSRETAKLILALDRCRGILANVVEQTRINEIGATGGRQLYTPAQRARTESSCREANARAEAGVRLLLRALAEQFAAKAQRKAAGEPDRPRLAPRAQVFARLSAAPDFSDTVFRTPRALQLD